MILDHGQDVLGAAGTRAHEVDGRSKVDGDEAEGCDLAATW